MKLGEILAKGDFSSYLAQAAEQDAQANATRDRFMTGGGFLKKFKIEADKKYAVLYPLEMCLPFNPANPDDESYSISRPFVLPGSVTSAIIAVKSVAKQNPAVANKLADVLGVDVSALNLDGELVIKNGKATDAELAEIRMWHKLCRIQFVTGYTQVLNTGKKQFAEKIGCEPIFDDDYNIIGTKGIGYTMFELETALISIKAQEIEDTYKPGGKNADKPQADCDAEKKALWKNRIISNPYALSYAQVVVFPLLNNEGKVLEESREAWAKDKSLRDRTFYTKITRNDVENTESYLSSDIYDCNIDFVEVMFTVPKEDPKDQMAIYREMNKSGASILTTITRPQANLDGLAEKYREARDNTATWNEKTLKKSIYDYRLRSDEALASDIKNAIKGYDSAMKSPDILDKYSNALEIIDSQLVASLAEDILSGKGTDKVIDTKVFAEAPKVDENTPESLADEIGSILDED